MRYAIIVLALLGVLASPRPSAAALTGNDLLGICETKLACGAHVMGWRDALYGATFYIYGGKAAGRNPKMGICIPKGATNGQLYKVLMKYLRDHPATLQRDCEFHQTPPLQLIRRR